jgi:hypothetical protein
MPKGPKRPADVIGNAVKVMRIAVGEDADGAPADDGKWMRLPRSRAVRRLIRSGNRKSLGRVLINAVIGRPLSAA